MLPKETIKNIAARLLGVAIVIALLGFYPSYLRILHTMCGIAHGHAVRFL